MPNLTLSASSRSLEGEEHKKMSKPSQVIIERPEEQKQSSGNLKTKKVR